MYIVTVKLPKRRDHDPHNKLTDVCPASPNGVECTDVTGEHHSFLVDTAEQVQSIRNSPTHVTRVEKIAADGDNRVGQLIRSTHWTAFRSGQWGRIESLETVEVEVGAGGLGVRKEKRLVYNVRWEGSVMGDRLAVTDQWPVNDPTAGYEFALVLK